MISRNKKPSTALERFQHCIKQCIFALISIILFFSLFEAGLRIIGFEKSELSFNDKNLFVIDLLWHPDPFESTILGRTCKQKPFRDEFSISTQPPPETLRIICIGGSVTEGSPFTPEDAYPRQLQNELYYSCQLPFNVQVLNAGGLGVNSYIGLFFFDHLCRLYKPDILTVHYTINDSTHSGIIGSIWTDREYVEFHRRARRSQFVNSLHGALNQLHIYNRIWQVIYASSINLSRKYRHYSYANSIFPHRVPPEDLQRNLHGFLDLGDQDGFEVVLMYEGNRDTRYKPELKVNLPYWEAVQQVARERDAVFIVPDRILSEQERSRESYYVDGCHMNKEGLRLFAKQLAKDLSETGVLNRAVQRKQMRR